jgi:hypothetical protein
MKKTLHIILLFALVGNFSCKKEMKKTKVEGIVRDFVTGNPLAGVEVYLQEYEYDQATTFVIHKATYQSTVTGNDGKFKFEFRALKEKTYGLEYQKPSECYFDNDAPITINKGKDNTIDWKLHSFVSLNLHVKNVSPFDINDHICYCFQKNAASCSGGITGMSIDYVSPITNINAYDKLYIKSFITKNSILTIKLDSITFSPCTSINYDLFY